MENNRRETKDELIACVRLVDRFEFETRDRKLTVEALCSALEAVGVLSDCGSRNGRDVFVRSIGEAMGESESRDAFLDFVNVQRAEGRF